MRKLDPIVDSKQIENLSLSVGALIEGSADLNLHWLQQKGWAVIPVESGGHFSDNDAYSLSEAFAFMRCNKVFAIATEPLENTPLAFEVPTTKQCLLEFSHTFGHYYYVLLSTDQSCVVLCTVDDYYLVAGAAEFVRPAVGGDIRAAMARFEELARLPLWRGRLADVAKRYEPFARILS